MSVELLKVEFRIVGLARDDEGGIIGEYVVADGAAYASGLDDLPVSVRKVVTEANESSPQEGRS